MRNRATEVSTKDHERLTSIAVAASSSYQDVGVAVTIDVPGSAHRAAPPLAADPAGGEWESVLRNNIIGAYNVFEACRQQQVGRIVAASTIQVSTGHRQQEPYNAVSQGRPEPLPSGVPLVSVDVPAEPRNLYASSKVFSESLCRTYAFSHGMSCLAIRIGWVVGEDSVPNARSEDIWCSQRDIAGLIRACVDAPEDLRFDILYGMSNNRFRWVDLSNARQKLGFEPQDRAEDRSP